jgi:exonuclease VII small subunit
MVKIDGKWYSLPNDDFGKTPEEAKAKIQKVLDTFDKGIARLDDVIAKLNAGKMTEQEFGAAMEEFGKGVQEIK